MRAEMAEVDQKQPAIVGGVIVGVLSVIPIVSEANTCCCLWALLGGMVAAKLLIDSSPQPVKAGDGAMVGLWAGLIGGAIRFFVGLPIELLTGGFKLRLLERLADWTGDPKLQELVQRIIEQAQTQSLLQWLIGAVPIFIIGALVLMGFTVLGGLLGVALFEKRKEPLTPPLPYPPYPPSAPPSPPPGEPQAAPPSPQRPADRPSREDDENKTGNHPDDERPTVE